MRLNTKILVAAIIIISAVLLISPVLLPSFNGNGGYVVMPGTGVPQGTGVVPVDARVVSFGQLPLWVQAAAAIDSLLILLGALKALPFIAGKIQNVFENRNRLNIFNYVQSNPGCTPSEISTRQNMKNGTVKYHLQMLESEGKIILRRMGKFTRLFNTSRMNSEQEKMILSHIKNETSKNLLQAINDDPGVTNQRLSERFRLDKSSIHWHMERFLNDNLVRFEQDGRYKKYFLEPDVSKYLTGVGH